MNLLNRRTFLSVAAAAVAATSLPSAPPEVRLRFSLCHPEDCGCDGPLDIEASGPSVVAALAALNDAVAVYCGDPAYGFFEDSWWEEERLEAIAGLHAGRPYHRRCMCEPESNYDISRIS
jgi:hypothetical protein